MACAVQVGFLATQRRPYACSGSYELSMDGMEYPCIAQQEG